MFLTLPTLTGLLALAVIPFLLERYVVIGFKEPPAKRRALYYLGTPITSLLVYISFAVLLGHPIIAFAGWLLVYGGFTIVSNLKNGVLGEPLVAHDLETARHLFIYPEFYVDYVGSTRLLTVVGTFITAIVVSYIFEPSFAGMQSVLPSWTAWALGLISWTLAMAVAGKLLGSFLSPERARRMGFTFDINTDVARFGHFPLMLFYAVMLMNKERSAVLSVKHKPLTHPGTGVGTAPDIIAMQAESYFDVDRLYHLIPGYENHGWQQLNSLRTAGAATGPLRVPAWGASTMQSEFAFLSGTDNAALGIDRINPYQRAAYTGVETLATRLRAAGYHTVCVHPAKKEFFRRSTVIPKLGFSEFVGIEAFENAARFGPYVSDKALGDEMEAIITRHKANSDKPLFLFAITIESHGPWDAGRLEGWLDEEALEVADPSRDRPFALFRRHMDNVLELFARLGPQAKLETNDRPRVLALYGDHQPACHELFARHGFEDRDVDYILWSSRGAMTQPGPMAVHDLGEAALKEAGFKGLA
ncbi:LTA synthase family protein [Kordiimonas sp.]|uniref:LTA synthase family protein n=1 Tax=Kordiimonas sp. TaxID=1970157 RepID=UPI003A93AFA2